MIVRKSSEGLHIIYQASHGLLAGKIAQELKEKHRPPYWLETLVAVIEHDDQQLDFEEKKYLSDLGVPLDFTENSATAKQVLKRCKRVFRQARSKSLWSALLVSYHLDFLYGDLKGEYTPAKEFLDSQESFRQQTRKHFSISKSKAKNYYEILRFCDRCSLILAKDQVPDLGRRLEINKSLNNKTYHIFRNEDNSFNVSPWCFEKEQFELSIEEFVIEQIQFKNQSEFQNYIYAKNPTDRVFTFNRAE